MTENVNSPNEPVVVETVTDDAPQDSSPVVVENVDATAVTTEESATSSADVSDSDTTTTPRSRAQERIEDLVAQRNAAKEYADYWRDKALEVLQANKTPPKADPVQIEPTSNEAPTLEQFKFNQSEWSKALSKFHEKQARAVVQEELRAERNSQEQAQVLSNFESKVDAFKADHADWDILMANPKLPQLDRVASAMVIASEHAAALTYALAKNPDQAVKISRMNPAQQALAIGRLENEVSKPVNTTSVTPPVPKPKPKVVSAAPVPPTPVPSGGSPTQSPETMDKYEWMKWRQEQARNRRR